MDIKEILNTDESKFNFLKGLIRLSKIDGIESEEEKVFFEHAGINLELSESKISSLNTYWDTTEKIDVIFNTKKESLLFIREAIQLCSIDDFYNDDEKKEIRLLAKELNITESSIEKIESWVENGLKWNSLGESLLTLEN